MSIGKYEITTENGVNRLEIEVLFDGIPSKPLTAEYRDGEWILIQTCPVCAGCGTVPVRSISAGRQFSRSNDWGP